MRHKGKLHVRHKVNDRRTDHSDGTGLEQRARLNTMADLDHRTRAYKHARRLTREITSDLGGEDHVTHAQKELIARAAVMSALMADMESRYLKKEEALDVEAYCKLVNTQGRVIGSLGLKRVPKDVTPDLETYLERKKAEDDNE
jgi:hypothetical protein